jgi:DNA-binding NarL/FixJ family response regulator
MGADVARAYAEGVVKYGAKTMLQLVKVVNQFQAIVSGLRAQLRLRSHRVDSGHCPAALAIMAEGPGRDALQIVFREAGWRLTIAETSAPALDRRTEPPPIILYERELNPCHWRELVSRLSRLSPRPYVILLSSSFDTNLWDELVRHGGSEILRTPIDPDAVMRAVKSGWSLWRNQQRLRLAAAARS